LNDEKSFYINSNRPRLEIFKIISSYENKIINDENFLANKNEEIKNNYASSIVSEINIINDKVEFKKNKSDSLNNKPGNKIENKDFNIIDDFTIEDNFKRLISDLIPKNDFYEDYFEQEFILNKRNQKINVNQRKHSF
jgi:hypothetical protein